MSQQSEDSSVADTREARLTNPSGWLELTRHESCALIVDALLGLPPRREFNQTELADHAGVSRQTVWSHLDLLLALDVLEPVPETSPQRYRLAESAVVQELLELNSALNAARDTEG